MEFVSVSLILHELLTETAVHMSTCYVHVFLGRLLASQHKNVLQ